MNGGSGLSRITLPAIIRTHHHPSILCLTQPGPNASFNCYNLFGSKEKNGERHISHFTFEQIWEGNKTFYFILLISEILYFSYSNSTKDWSVIKAKCYVAKSTISKQYKKKTQNVCAKKEMMAENVCYKK